MTHLNRRKALALMGGTVAAAGLSAPTTVLVPPALATKTKRMAKQRLGQLSERRVFRLRTR